jgi:hypothetical protein
MLPTRNVKPLITEVKEVFPIGNPDSIELFILIVVSFRKWYSCQAKMAYIPIVQECVTFIGKDYLRVESLSPIHEH